MAVTTLAEHAPNALAAQTLEKLGPGLVRRGPLMELLNYEGDEPTELAARLKRSPELAARVVSVINSAAFGIVQPMASIERAVIMLGVNRAKTLALAHGLWLLAQQSDEAPRDLLHNLWFNALVKAQAAERFCRLLDPGLATQAHCLGLIQDIGLAMLMDVDMDFYRRLCPTRKATWAQQETEHFGIDHAQVGRLVLQSWSAASNLQSAVAVHHQMPHELTHQDDMSLLHFASFTASLLPHLHEPVDDEARGWLHAIYARFLSNEMDSPEQLIEQSIAEARKVAQSEKNHPAANHEQLTRQLLTGVLGDVTRMVGSLSRLEAALGRRVKKLSSSIVQLKDETLTDPLTSLLNRRGLDALAPRAIRRAQFSGSGFCVMLLDADRFKQVNDQYGHAAGDLVLEHMASRLRQSVRPRDLVGRVGGDEMAGIFSDITPEQARDLAERISQAMTGQPVMVSPGVQLNMSVSIGAVYWSKLPNQFDLSHALAHADHAMYERKQAGRRGVHFESVAA